MSDNLWKCRACYAIVGEEDCDAHTEEMHDGREPGWVAYEERVYDRSIPLRMGTVLAKNKNDWTYQIQWDDGPREWRNIDSLGAVPVGAE